VDHSQSSAYSELPDSEFESRVELAASADVRRMLRTARRRRRERWLVGGVVLVAVALVLVLLAQIGLFDGDRTPAAVAPATSEPAGSVSLAQDWTHPFATSPAANWPDGAAGIELPAAHAVGAFTTDQVGTAVRQVRDLLVASRLDPEIVVNHDPSRFLAAFAPDARRQLRPLFGTGQEAQAQALVSMVSDGAQLLPVEPKVSGRMTVQAGEQNELVVHTNYVFVYPFHTDAPNKIVDVMDVLVVVRAEVDYVLRSGTRWARDSQGWWYGETGGNAYSIACDSYRKGFLAPAFTERTSNEASGQDRGRYFDIDSPLPAASGCPG
jgi:hypothetical protein